MAAFEPGVSGNPAGRPVGSGRVKDFRKYVIELCKDRGFCPFKKMIDLATMVEDVNIQFKAASALLPYMAPKLQSIMVENATNEEGGRLVFVMGNVSTNEKHKLLDNNSPDRLELTPAQAETVKEAIDVDNDSNV